MPLTPDTPTLATDGFEVLVDGGLTQVLTDQSPQGRAVMLGLLDALCVGAKPLMTEAARAEMERSNALWLYGEATVLACEAEGYANPFAKTYGQKMTAAEREAAAAHRDQNIEAALSGQKLVAA